ncbi:hypothetical protein [Kordia sp.]|uniref:hypothetical protein n=1 Tax=Kordia sp. TaxID=1965332 RepID=UPI003B58ECDC
MKKTKFSEKLQLNKNVVSNLDSNYIVGGGPTWQFTCLDDCISVNAKKYACHHPIYTDDCPGSVGCEPVSAVNC